MAVGLTNRLIDGGIKVPEQVRVTGYDAAKEAIFNTVSVTTYTPDVYSMAAQAVNLLHEQINPEIPGLWEPTDQWDKEFSNDRIWS